MPLCVSARLAVKRAGRVGAEIITASDYHDPIRQTADAANLNVHFVSLVQSERVRRDDASAGQQHGAVRKGLAAKEKLRQFLETAFDLARRRFHRRTQHRPARRICSLIFQSRAAASPASNVIHGPSAQERW